MDIPTWQQFWSFIQTPVGLGAAVVAIIGLLKRLDNEKFPTWLRAVGRFIVENAMVASIGVAILLSLLVFLIREYSLGQYIEQYFIILALAWAASQGGYALQKATGMYYGRVRGGDRPGSTGT